MEVPKRDVGPGLRSAADGDLARAPARLEQALLASDPGGQPLAGERVLSDDQDPDGIGETLRIRHALK